MISTVPCWTAFLALQPPDRQAFLNAAAAFTIAETALAEPNPVQPLASSVATQPVTLAPAEPRLRRSSAIIARRSAETLADSARSASLAGSAPPLIGGASLDLSPRAVFATEEFLSRWRPGIIVRGYLAGCSGLRDLMRPLRRVSGTDLAGLQAWKSGTALDISMRMAKLNQVAYGSVSRASTGMPQPGFDSWAAEPLPVAALEPSPMSPVAVTGDAFEITLPSHGTHPAFDQAVARALAGASLAGWAMSALGRAACEARGVDPLTLVRGSIGPNGRVVWSTELILIRPRHDAPRLLRLLEQIIIDDVMANAPSDGSKVRSNKSKLARRSR